MIRIFIKRFFRRLINSFRFKEMWQWKYESCVRCGSCYRITYHLRNSTWNEIKGNENGCLCMDCLLILAQEKNITLDDKTIDGLFLFDPDNRSGGNIDIIKE